MAFFWMALAAIGFVFFILIVSALWATRCPSCGWFFRAKVVGQAETASVDTEEEVYDQESGRFRTVRRNQRGYLVDYVCRSCSHSWQRMSSTSRSNWLT